MTIAFAYGIYEAFSFAYLAKIFPLYISLVLFVLSVINLTQEIQRHFARVKEGGAGTAEIESHWDMPMADVWTRLVVYVGFILTLYLGIWIIGYPLSITFFIIVFYRYATKTGWIGALIAGAAGLGFLALVSKLLSMHWPEGLIRFPWPFG